MRVIALQCALLASLASPTLGAASQASFDEKLRAEIERLRQRVSLDQMESEDRRKSIQGLVDRLGEVEAEIEAGRSYYALVRLGGVHNALESLAYVLEASEIEAAGLEAFEPEWRKAGNVLNEKEAAYRAAEAAVVPVAVRALAEASWRRSRPYYLSSLTFAKGSGMEAGLYYLGAARERLDFALFCRKLDVETLQPPPTLPPPTLKALAGHLDRLEAEIGEAYADADAAIEHHSRFIGLNSAVKEARELDADGLHHGALYKLLDARRGLEGILAIAKPAPSAAALRQRAEPARRRLTAGTADHSLGRLFLEMAESSLADAESAEDAGDLRSAAVILESVLPEYFNLIEEPTP